MMFWVWHVDKPSSKQNVL